MTAFHLTDPAIITALRDALEAGRDECITIVEGEPCNPNPEFAGDCLGPEGCTGWVPPERFRVLDNGQAWEITITCPTCEGRAWDWKRYADSGMEVDDPVDEFWCETCATPAGEGLALSGNGRVVLCKAAITVAPVVDYETWEITCEPVPCITVDAYDQSVFMIEGDGGGGAYGEVITLDPLPVPGRDFGIIWKITT